MTTPPTPAGWYPDPEDSSGLRYWDGATWTEHRSPAQAPPAPQPSYGSTEYGTTDPYGVGESTPAPSAEPADRGGAHRAPDPSEPATEQPTTKVPLFESTPEPPRESAYEPPPEPAHEPPPEQAYEPAHEPAPLPITEQPTTRVPLREPMPYADATTPTPAEPQEVEPPAGTEPLAPPDNRKLLLGFAGAVAALLVVLALAAVYAFVIHKDEKIDIGAPTVTSTSTTTKAQATTSEETTATEPPPASGATASDGAMQFTVTGVENGTTVSDPTNESLTKDAQGEFIVVRLTVVNTSPDPATFLGTFQKLKAAGQVYSIDDEASFYVGGGYADIPPGGQADVGVAYDVPPGTVPESIELHADPMSAGVELPLQ